MYKLVNVAFALILIATNSCNGQQSADVEFSEFVANFSEVTLPLNIDEFYSSLESKRQMRQINEADFDKFLRTSSDTFWSFNNNFEYYFGGVYSLESCSILFYSRYYYSSDNNIDKQIGETILVTFNSDKKQVSNVPIAGGYGDSLRVKAVLNSTNEILMTKTIFNGSSSKVTDSILSIKSDCTYHTN